MDNKDSMFGTKDGGIPMTAEERCGSYGAEHFVDWLIKYKGTNLEQRDNIISNLRSGYQAERAIGFIEGRAKNEVHIHFSLFGARNGK